MRRHATLIRIAAGIFIGAVLVAASANAKLARKSGEDQQDTGSVSPPTRHCWDVPVPGPKGTVRYLHQCVTY